MREKNQNIEMLRAISCMMVIMIHVANYFNRAYGKITEWEYIFSTFCNVLCRVSVPCFFMISGALLLHRQDSIKQSLKRAFRVLIVLLVWSVIYYVFNVYFMNTPVELREILVVPVEAHLWYLYVLIPIYLALPLLQWICGKMKPWMEKAILYFCAGLTIISTVVIAFEQLHGFVAEQIFGASSLFYMFTGHVIVKNKEKIIWKTPVWLFLYFASCVLNALLTCAFSFARSQHETLFFKYRSALIMIATICFFIYIIKRERIWQGKCIISFCKCTFGIYLMHILFLDLFKKYVKPWDVSAYWTIPILTLGIGLATWGSIWVFRRCRIGNKIS